MGYALCFYENTREVHILNNGRALCGTINETNCQEMGIYVNRSIFKPFENLSKNEALAVAESLQVLSGINICGHCVASLYRNE